MAIKGAIHRLAIDVSATGAGTEGIVEGISGKVIQVLSLFVTSELDANVKFQTGSTDLSGVVYLAARGGMVIAHQPFAIFQTADGEDFNMYRTATGNFGGSIVYVQGEL